MIDIKISLPNHGSNLSFKNFHSKNQNHKIKYHINSDIPKADGWIVMEDLKNEAETCEVPKNNIFYLNNETSYEKDYFFGIHMEKYFDQFTKGFGCYANNKKDYVSSIPFLPWMIHANHGDEIFANTNFDFDYFYNLNKIEKTIDLSVICSNKSHTPNHSLRLEFVNILKNHFGERMLWYGNGINQIEKKSDIIFNSKYHIVIENDSRNNLVSEKLYDSFLGLSFPIYYGATNINELFDKESLIIIDINDVNSSIKTIEHVLDSNLYQENFSKLIESKNKVLDEFNIFNRLNKLVEENITSNSSEAQEITLYNSNYYWKKTTSSKKKIKRIIKRKMRLN